MVVCPHMSHIFPNSLIRPIPSQDCMVEPPYCTPYSGRATDGIGPESSDDKDAWYNGTWLMNDCGNSFVAKLYFISFYIIRCVAFVCFASDDLSL